MKSKPFEMLSSSPCHGMSVFSIEQPKNLKVNIIFYGLSMGVGNDARFIFPLHVAMTSNQNLSLMLYHIKF